MNTIFLLGAFGTNELVIILLILILPIAALVDILRTSFKDSTNKIIWALIVLLIPILGTIIYFIIGANQKLPKEND
ncbi:MAG: PLDc_N domain-containing protein [Niabella sp.]|nr:PLDc_N domain-containing protein [Niabella sp.]